jgi:hypothetical protein
LDWLGANETILVSQPGPPQLNSTIKNAPDIRGLTPDCANIAWYNLADVNQTKNIHKKDSTLGNYTVTFKPHVTEEQADRIMYSPEVRDGTEQKLWHVPALFLNLTIYLGRWNLTQLCYLEHQPEVCVCVSAGYIRLADAD